MKTHMKTVVFDIPKACPQSIEVVPKFEGPFVASFVGLTFNLPSTVSLMDMCELYGRVVQQCAKCNSRDVYRKCSCTINCAQDEEDCGCPVVCDKCGETKIVNVEDNMALLGIALDTRMYIRTQLSRIPLGKGKSEVTKQVLTGKYDRYRAEMNRGRGYLIDGKSKVTVKLEWPDRAPVFKTPMKAYLNISYFEKEAPVG